MRLSKEESLVTKAEEAAAEEAHPVTELAEISADVEGDEGV